MNLVLRVTNLYVFLHAYAVCGICQLLLKYGVKPGDAVLAEEKHQPVYAELVKDFKVTCLS